MLQEVSAGAGVDRLEAGHCIPPGQGRQAGPQLQVPLLETVAQSL